MDHDVGREIVRLVAPGTRLVPCQHDSAAVRGFPIEFFATRVDDTVVVLHFAFGDESAFVDDDGTARGEVIEAQVCDQPACLGGNGGTHGIVDEEATGAEEFLLRDETGREVTHAFQSGGVESVEQVGVGDDAVPKRVVDAMLTNAASDEPTPDRVIDHSAPHQRLAGALAVQESASSPSFLKSASSAARALSSLDVPVVDASAGDSCASAPNSASNC